MQKTVGIIVVLAGLGSAIWFLSPATRTAIERETETLLGWTEAARQADPVGFLEHVETTLTDDLAELRKNRRALAGEVADVAKQHREQSALLNDAWRFASEFRTAWQAEEFPVTVRDAAYSEVDLKAQVSSLLAEIDGHEANVARLQKIRTGAEKQLEELAVRIEKTRTDLAAIGTQREMLRSRVLSDDAETLLAQVDSLFRENQETIHDNPVRSVRELLAAAEQEDTQKGSADADRVIAFLTTSPAGVEPAAPAGQTETASTGESYEPGSAGSLNEIDVISKARETNQPAAIQQTPRKPDSPAVPDRK